MKNFVLILSILLFTVSVFSQTENNVSGEVYKTLFPETDEIFKPNDEIELLIEVLDENLILVIDTLVNYKSLNYTILMPYNTKVCNCSNKKEFTENTYFLNEKIGGTRFSYSELWKETNGDTLKYLKKVKEYYRGPFEVNGHKYSLPKYELNLAEYTSKMNLSNLLVYDNEINFGLKLLLKNNRKTKKEYIKYLSENIDFFNSKKKIVEPKSIGIEYIIIGCESKIYAGIDIYGSHYLLSIDKQNKSIEKNERLWIY